MENSVILASTEINSPVGIESDEIPDISEFGLVERSLLNRPEPGEKGCKYDIAIISRSIEAVPIGETCPALYPPKMLVHAFRHSSVWGVYP